MCYNQIVKRNLRKGELKWIHHSFANILLAEGQINDETKSMLLMKDVESVEVENYLTNLFNKGEINHGDYV